MNVIHEQDLGTAVVLAKRIQMAVLHGGYQLNGELLGLFERERFAGLFVTHSVNEAAFLASRVLVMSARPGRIVAEIEVPFAYPRSPELRFEPEFAAVAGQISARLREKLA